MFDTLRDILVTKLKVNPVQITPDATLEDVDLDSLALVELATILRQDHGISVTDDELTELGTVQQVVELLEQRHPTSA